MKLYWVLDREAIVNESRQVEDGLWKIHDSHPG